MKKENVNTDNDTNKTTKISTTIHDNNNINNTMISPEESEILNTKEDMLIKNDEISAYKTLLKIAEGVMDIDAINILKQNLQEKESIYDKIKSSETKMVNDLKENNNDEHDESFKIGSAVADMLTSYWNSQGNTSKVYLFNRRVHHGAIGALLGLSSLYKKNSTCYWCFIRLGSRSSKRRL
ncbi:MAG TPA: hypothetical protein VJ583_06715 [Nitrososphaeraceae archaeon]|nr:hypothetical protein [Nitrososphaeraceae archaeon]